MASLLGLMTDGDVVTSLPLGHVLKCLQAAQHHACAALPDEPDVRPWGCHKRDKIGLWALDDGNMGTHQIYLLLCAREMFYSKKFIKIFHCVSEL